MQRNAHKELKKRSQYIYIGFLFVLIAFFIGTLDYWDTKKIHAWDSVNTKLFFEQHPEDKEVLEEQIVQVSEEELPENTTESTNSEPTVANYYVGYLEIPKINLKRGFAAFGSPYNNVDKNVTILSLSCNSNSIGLDDKKIRCTDISSLTPIKDFILSGSDITRSYLRLQWS